MFALTFTGNIDGHRFLPDAEAPIQPGNCCILDMLAFFPIPNSSEVIKMTRGLEVIASGTDTSTAFYKRQSY